MICPICEAWETQTTNTVELGFAVYRRRRCKDPECQAVVFSKELECSEAEYIAAREKKNQTRKKIREIRRRMRK
jgi:hypothetical protein